MSIAGVVLWDLAKRTSIRVFDHIVPQDMSEDAQTRSITSCAVHPQGEIFAVGHLDGSISFWSFEYEKSCLGRRCLPSNDAKSVPSPKEPVFRIAWSSFPDLEECKQLLSVAADSSKTPILPRLVGATLDYSGGETTLTVLGGLSVSDPVGVRVVQFPPFDVLSFLADPTNSDPAARLVALKQAVIPLSICRIPSSRPINDFLLVPRSNPHFNGAHDPIAIIQTFSFDGPSGATQAIEALEFPPPISAAPSHYPPAIDEDLKTFVARPFDIKGPPSESPRLTFRLPWPIISEHGPILGASMARLDRGHFSMLVRHWIETGVLEEAEGVASGRRLPLRAGTALGDAAVRVNPNDPYFILITRHADLSVRFADCSPQILASSTPRFEFPQPLPHLNIDLIPLLSDPSLGGLVQLDSHTAIKSVHLSPNAMHCAIVLHSGEAVFFAFTEKESPPDLSLSMDGGDLDDEQSVVVALNDLGKKDSDGYWPRCMLDSRHGSISAISLTDEGLQAIAYRDGTLLVIASDSIRVLHIDEGSKSKWKNKEDFVCSLKWLSSETSSASLLAIHDSGIAYRFRFLAEYNPDPQWSYSVSTKTPIKTSLDCATYSFLVPATSPNVGGLSSALGALSVLDDAKSVKSAATSSTVVELEDYWVLCSAKEIKCFSGVGGERVSKADWKDEIQHSDVVELNGRKVLVGFTSWREALVYSLPDLSYSHTLQLPEGPKLLGTIITQPNADFFEFQIPDLSPNGYPFAVTHSSLFHSRRSRSPAVDFGQPTWPMPTQPAHPSVENSYTSWIWGPKVYTGREIDAILAGPNRPPPKGSESSLPKSPTRPSTQPRRTSSDRPASPESAASRSRSGDDVYSRLTNALTERGEMLSGLEDSFNSLENATKSMSDQAKRIAAQASARRFFF